MRKRLIFALGLLFIFLSSNIPTLHAQNVQNFTIDSFEADYYLSKNEQGVAILSVVETIAATFPSFDQNHGIERALPSTYRGETLGLAVKSVEDGNGNAQRYASRSSGDNTILRIGDADTYVHGKQGYVIRYDMLNVVRSENDKGEPYGYDELYWDVNGTEWSQQFGSVTARLHIPSSLIDTLQTFPIPSCYTGAYNSTARDCIISAGKQGEEMIISAVTNGALAPKETLTFVVTFREGTFQKYVPPPINPLVVLGVIAAVLLLGVAPPLLAFLIMLGKWKRGGRDPKGRGVIVPQYQPTKGMNPVIASIILEQNVVPKSVSATIIDLCVKGYFKLYETRKKKLLGTASGYELELMKTDQSLDAESKAVVKMLFPSEVVGSRVAIDDLSKTLYKDVQALGKVTGDAVVAEGYFELSPEKARKKYYAVGIALCIIGFVGLYFFFAGIGLLLAGIITLIFSSAMPKRTPKGVEMRDYLKGLEMYMKLAEADRIKFLQSPDTAEKINTDDKKVMIKLYEKLLPYAILFGIEKEWAKKFSALYDTESSPSWYSGNTAFNAIIFSNAISSFSNVTTTSFAPPSSSGSSGAGGGFSGGGGGGGGGGGW